MGKKSSFGEQRLTDKKKGTHKKLISSYEGPYKILKRLDEKDTYVVTQGTGDGSDATLVVSVLRMKHFIQMPKWLEDIRNLNVTLVGYKPLLNPSWGVEPMDEEEEYREPGEMYISPKKVAEVFCYRHVQTSTEEVAQGEALLEQNTIAPLEDPILPKIGNNEPTPKPDKAKRKRKKKSQTQVKRESQTLRRNLMT